MCYYKLKCVTPNQYIFPPPSIFSRVTPIGFLFEPVTNSSARIRLGLKTWNDMQMGMEYGLPSYRPAIPAQIVALWIVFSINPCFDLGKEGKCGGEFFGGEIERRLTMDSWNDYS